MKEKQKILSAEEILKKHVPENKYWWENKLQNVPTEFIYAAMQEFASQYQEEHEIIMKGHIDSNKLLSETVETLKKENKELLEISVKTQHDNNRLRQEPCLRWVNASERLPLHMVTVIFRPIGMEGGMGGRYDYHRKMFVGNGIFAPEKVEWLEELPKSELQQDNDRPCLRWVKASERLPEKNGRYVVLDASGDAACYWYYNDSTTKWWYDSGCYDYVEDQDKLEIKWLEELPKPSTESE